MGLPGMGVRSRDTGKGDLTGGECKNGSVGKGGNCWQSLTSQVQSPGPKCCKASAVTCKRLLTSTLAPWRLCINTHPKP